MTFALKILLELAVFELVHHVFDRRTLNFFGCIPIECRSRTTRLNPRNCAADIPRLLRRTDKPARAAAPGDKLGNDRSRFAKEPPRLLEETAEPRVAKTLFVRERPRDPPKGSPIPPKELSTPIKSLIASPCISARLDRESAIV